MRIMFFVTSCLIVTFGSLPCVGGVKLHKPPETFPSPADFERAERLVPRAHALARGPAAIRAKLNTALRHGDVAMPNAKPCEEFKVEDLHRLRVDLFRLRSPQLPTYGARALRHATEEALVADYESERTEASRHSDFEALRINECHEIAMAWVHHVSEGVRASFAGVSLPLLPVKGLEDLSLDQLARQKNPVVGALCSTAHALETAEPEEWTGFPNWPQTLQFDASGYGMYPFWGMNGLAGPGDQSALVKSHPEWFHGGSIHVHYSATYAAERFDHGFCYLTGLNTSVFSSNGPCTNLMLGNYRGFLYDAGETACCITSYPEDTYGKLAPMDTNFWNESFSGRFGGSSGEMDHYAGEAGFYAGPVKWYQTHVPIINATTDGAKSWFWYVTTPDGLPVEQGEGLCAFSNINWTSDVTSDDECLRDNILSNSRMHQYDITTFNTTSFDTKVFDVPSVCEQTTQECKISAIDNLSKTVKDMIAQVASES